MKQKYREGAFTKFLTQKAAKLRVPISSAFELGDIELLRNGLILHNKQKIGACYIYC